MTGWPRPAQVAGIALAATIMAACGPRRLTLPTGPGRPYPDYAAAYDAATSSCRAVTTITASLALSGRAGTTKLRGRIDAGFAPPSEMRLDGFPPVMFGGRPFFTLVARGSDATLVLPRDGRVLRGARPPAIIDALAGVPLDTAELRSVLSGCGLGLEAAAANGRSYEPGWVAVDAGPSTVYLRQLDNRWRIAGVTRPPLTVEYGEYQADRPGTVRLRSASSTGTGSDITLRLSQVDVGGTLDRKVFEIDVPSDARPITLDELRRAGPLGGA
jgi:hypothetical protein